MDLETEGKTEGEDKNKIEIERENSIGKQVYSPSTKSYQKSLFHTQSLDSRLLGHFHKSMVTVNDQPSVHPDTP
jgi:hypothetical protein